MTTAHEDDGAADPERARLLTWWKAELEAITGRGVDPQLAANTMLTAAFCALAETPDRDALASLLRRLTRTLETMAGKSVQ